MDLDAIAKAAITVGAPLAGLIGLGGGRRRLRAEIRDNLALVDELQKDPIFSQHTPTVGWLAGKIVVDIARLAGQPLGPKKKRIPWGSIVSAALLGLGTGLWTYAIDREGFLWYSVFPGTFALAMFISIWGMFINRQLPADPELPAGATPMRSDTTEEQIAGSLQLATSGVDREMFAEDGQVGVALRFIGLMRGGKYEDALALADSNWSLCRIQARLWNMYQAGTLTRDVLSELAESLHTRREPDEFWKGYIAAESEQMVEAWSERDPSNLGAASRRRRMARNYDLVILAPLGASTEGYFVTEATMVPNAVVFLMHKVDGRWLVSNHVGTAPPTPGLPPVWWTALDRTFDDLPDEGAAEPRS